VSSPHPVPLVYTGGPRASEGWIAGRVIDLMGQLNVGVYLFFVISGYCIAAASDSARRHGSPVRRYFWRRFRRIYPPLWILNWRRRVGLRRSECETRTRAPERAALCAAEALWYSPSQWPGNLSLTEIWRYHVWGSSREPFPGQAWTLCYEEQFLAIAGALLLAPRLMFAGAGVVTGFTIATILIAPRLHLAIDGFGVALGD